jgi:hypothetical protein
MGDPSACGTNPIEEREIDDHAAIPIELLFRPLQSDLRSSNSQTCPGRFEFSQLNYHSSPALSSPAEPLTLGHYDRLIVCPAHRSAFKAGRIVAGARRRCCGNYSAARQADGTLRQRKVRRCLKLQGGPAAGYIDVMRCSLCFKQLYRAFRAGVAGQEVRSPSDFPICDLCGRLALLSAVPAAAREGNNGNHYGWGEGGGLSRGAPRAVGSLNLSDSSVSHSQGQFRTPVHNP